MNHPSFRPFRLRMSGWAMFLLMLGIALSAVAATNFYKENRNGKVFILQVDPATNISTVFNPEKSIIFLAPKAQRIAALPTAGWGEYTSNKDPLGQPLGMGEQPGDPNGILSLRIEPLGVGVNFKIYRGKDTLLWSFKDPYTTFDCDSRKYDIAVSQYMGKNRDVIRVYTYFDNFLNSGPAVIRMVFQNNVASGTIGYRFLNGLPAAKATSPFTTGSSNWVNVSEAGDMGTAESISVNAISETQDLLVYHPTRRYSLQHVWDAAKNNGSWGTNYLMDNNRVYKANSTNPLANNINQMSQIFDVGLELGNADVESVLYYRSYYNHGNTFVLNNVNANATLEHMYGDIHDPAGTLVDIRDGSPTGDILETTRVNPNPTVLGHNAVGLYGLACKNALAGSEMIVYEPVYKINRGPILEGEFTDNNRNHVPDYVDAQGYWNYRSDYFIDRGAGSTLSTDYELDFVIAHRFPLSGKNANTEFSYQEYAIERDPTASPSRLIPGSVVRLRVGNIYHRDPDVYGEYNQFGWDGNPGHAVFIWAGNPGNGYNGQTNPQKRNSCHILGIAIKNTSYATADYFGVVGNDDWAAGQGDLYFLSKKFGTYTSPRIVERNNPYTPATPNYGYWWKFQYDRSTTYGISRTYWIGAKSVTDWLNSTGFFIGNSVFSQMVYAVNCGCRGLRYDNFQKVSEASSPLLDFAIVNIGSPPFIDGTISPTIVANNGGSVVQPNTPVYFTGGYEDPAKLIDPSTVKFRYVILDDTFDDVDPSLSSKLVIDSTVVNGGQHLSTPNWSYVFKNTDLRGRSVATFTVYLGIQFTCQDYTQIPYPSYSWWGAPWIQKFAWSNSRNGAYCDGQRHDRWGAPLRITVNTRLDPTPEHPVVIQSVQANSDLSGGWTSGVVKVDQNKRVKLRATGFMLFQSEIPEPRDTNFSSMGGVMPWPFGNPQTDNHYRVGMDSAGNQYDYGHSTNLTATEFAKDLAGIKYSWYIRAKIRYPDKRLVGYTRTIPSLASSHLLNPDDWEGFEEIATGTLDGVGQVKSGLFDPGPCTVNVVHNQSGRLTNQRKFTFTIETPWMYIPVPLDGGFTDDKLFDKYEVRLALKYPVSQWSQVTVKNYNTNTLTNSYNCSKVEDQVEKSFSSNTAQRVWLRVLDKVGPLVERFAPDVVGVTGDPCPRASLSVRMRENNPHECWKRGALVANSDNDNPGFPNLRYAVELGIDRSLNLTNEPEIDLAGWDQTNRFAPPPYIALTSSRNIFWGYRSSPVALGSWSYDFQNFPVAVQLALDPSDPSVSSGNIVDQWSLAEPCFNRNAFTQHWVLYEGNGAPNFDSSGQAISSIQDGSGNPLSGGVATGTTTVIDNDPPNLRVIVKDDVNLDIMIEILGGYRDGRNNHAPRTIRVTDLKTRSGSLFAATVATTTATVPVASMTETYNIAAMNGATPVGYSISKPFDSGKVPFPVYPDSRLRLVGEGFDQAGPTTLPVSLTIQHPDGVIRGSGAIEGIFRRGLTSQTANLTAEVADGAGHRVILRIPIVVGAPGMVDVRSIEESGRKGL